MIERDAPSPSDESEVGARLMRLYQAVHESPYQFDFFALLRTIESLQGHRPRLGKALRPRDEPLRLGHDAELDFAPAAISSFQWRGDRVPRLGQRFLGLFGPMGPLPLHLTEYVRERAHNHGDATLARFADQFHHRLLLLFYRAWAQPLPTVHLDRRADDAFSRWVGSFAGIGDAAFCHRDSVADHAKRHRVAILARGAKSAEGLVTLLRSHFGTDVRVEPHVGHWLPIHPEDRTRLLPPTRPGLRNVLGAGAVAGSRVWDRQFRFRVHLGPMSYAQYQRFLPRQRAIAELRDWVRQYVGLALSFDVVAWLRAAEVPPLRLGVAGAQDGRLGWTTWLGASRPRADRGDLRVSPEREAHRNASRRESAHG